jgi:HEAT repeat protein
MPMNLKQLRNQLSATEPTEGTYFGIGPAEIPLLEQLLQDQEGWMAARAIYALSRISDTRAVNILSQAVAHPRQEVRVALAACASHLRPEDANGILTKLLTDTDMGVRKFAIKAVSEAHSTAVHAKLRDLETQDQAPWVRELAKSKLRELNAKQ